MIDLIDSHCHIQDIDLKKDANLTAKIWDKAGVVDTQEVIDSAKAAGVTRLIVVGCDYPDSVRAIELAKKQPNLYASAGIHPHEAKSFVNSKELQAKFASLANQDKVVAIGECGLDYHYNHSSRDDQIKVFKFQLELAEKSNLPLIFHVREAFDDFWPLFNQHKSLKGVLHSFTDNMANLEKALSCGLYIGVNGIATFSKDPDQLDVYKSIPTTNLLLETDSPYLTPVPYRGNINRPEMVERVAQFLAEIKQEDLSQLAKTTTENSIKLFGIN